MGFVFLKEAAFFGLIEPVSVKALKCPKCLTCLIWHSRFIDLFPAIHKQASTFIREFIWYTYLSPYCTSIFFIITSHSSPKSSVLLSGVVSKNKYGSRTNCSPMNCLPLRDWNVSDWKVFVFGTLLTGIEMSGHLTLWTRISLLGKFFWFFNDQLTAIQKCILLKKQCYL